MRPGEGQGKVWGRGEGMTLLTIHQCLQVWMLRVIEYFAKSLNVAQGH